MSDKLAVLTDVERRLAKIATVDEAKSIRDQAEAIRIYAKNAGKGLVIQNQAALIKIQAERRAGELLSTMDRAKRGKPNGNGLPKPPTMGDLGIKPMQAHRWQTMALVSRERVSALESEATAAAKELTSASVYSIGNKYKKGEKVAEPFHWMVALGELRELIEKKIAPWPADAKTLVPKALRDLAEILEGESSD